MRKHLKYLRKEKGMTLVELLAVLVILGIVAAIAVPAISNVIDNSRDKATVSEAVSIIEAAKLASTVSPSKDGIYKFVKNSEKNDLEEYLDSNVKATSFTVTGAKNSEWKITGHPAVEIVKGKGATEATESDLTEFLD